MARIVTLAEESCLEARGHMLHSHYGIGKFLARQVRCAHVSVWSSRHSSLIFLVKQGCALHDYWGPAASVAKPWGPRCFGPTRRHRRFASAQTWGLPHGRGRSREIKPPKWEIRWEKNSFNHGLTKSNGSWCLGKTSRELEWTNQLFWGKSLKIFNGVEPTHHLAGNILR